MSKFFTCITFGSYDTSMILALSPSPWATPLPAIYLLHSLLIQSLAPQLPSCFTLLDSAEYVLSLAQEDVNNSLIMIQHPMTSWTIDPSPRFMLLSELVQDENARVLPSPTSPTARRRASRPRPVSPAPAADQAPLESLPPSSFAVGARPSSPASVHVADKKRTASEAVRAILSTPSPVRIIRAPIRVKSTPLGRLPHLEASLRPFARKARQWNANAEFSDEADENEPIRYPKRKTPPGDDDLFGLLAAEKKLKTIRQQRMPVYDPVRPGLSHVDEEDAIEDEDKDNLPTEVYNLSEKGENICPPHLGFNDIKEHDPPPDGPDRALHDNETDKNVASASVAPILLASAKTMFGLDQLLAEPSSSSGPSRMHALRNPHNPRSAQQRSPLPTPHFSHDGDVLGDSPATTHVFGGVAMARAKPEPVQTICYCEGQGQGPMARDPVLAQDKGKAEPSKIGQPLAALEDEDPYAEPAKVAGKKRTRAQVGPTQAGRRARVRNFGAAVAEMENRSGSRHNDEGMGSDSPPLKASTHAARERGRGRERGGGGGGRGQGTAPAPNGHMSVPGSRGRSTWQGRPPTSKGKGKEWATDQVDPSQDEVRTETSSEIVDWKLMNVYLQERLWNWQEQLEYFKKLQEEEDTTRR
ncbi:hypothetical protein BD311DRAFT_742892 [Dichomitus squalens]|uniref:Uncharacterized protein n=1 Tax=Dichomitus squalens TaxID=114155 RepID=A0A4Q9M8W3_9APHY|nr:hypothetical protein BD311DRAFT_742892 [Dichomitus squalens]